MSHPNNADLTDKDTVAVARAAYDALTDDQKALILLQIDEDIVGVVDEEIEIELSEE